MTPHRADDRQSRLFDLPLAPEAAEETEVPRPDPAATPEEPTAPEQEGAEPAAGPAVSAPRRRDREVEASARLVAGGADLAVHLALLAAVYAGLRLMGVEPGLGGSPALLVLLLAFSFVYHLVPLAFWGRTPGMTVAGLEARSRDGERLTFGQAALRWVGAVAVAASAGLLALVALSGRSLADRLSRSATRPEEAAAGASR